MTVGTDELLQQRSIDLGRTLERVRPEFLRSRAPSPRFPNGAHADVYLDGTFLGGLEMLRLIRTSEVLEVRYMTPVEATVWFGREHPGGTLLVRTHWAPRF